MLILGVETSTPWASVAIGSEQGIIGSCLVSRGATQGAFILPAVEFLMRQADLSYRNLSAVAAGLGPGLYTGMRVGIATAKTLAQALSVPIVGVASLDLLAFEVRYSNRLICPVLDAKRKEVFFAFYKAVPGGVTRVTDYVVGTPERLLAEMQGIGEEILLVGSGALLYRHTLEGRGKVEFGSIASAFPRATSLVELALPRLFREDYDRLFDLEPMYMRRSDAEINWEKRRMG
ncbi:MAG: tRNA (adenosine(37)-N6)-threonylcarbamoyltransferase complex dimerization subunit type 1 TsaB [Actinomycetota bacterium]